MINIHTVTTQSPMSGMPAYGQTSGARVVISAFAGAQVSTCARARRIGVMGLTAKGGFPGTSAWRPPTC